MNAAQGKSNHREKMAAAPFCIVLLTLLLTSQARAATLIDSSHGALPPARVPIAASTPNQALITFLRSPLGIVGGGLLAVATGVAAASAFRALLQPHAQTRRRRSKGRRHRGREPAATAAAVSRPNQPVIAASIAAGCLLLPLVFTIAISDVFALPKTLALWMLAGLVALLLTHAVTRGARPLRAGLIDASIVTFAVFNLAATIMSVDRDHSIVGEPLQYQGLLSMVAYGVLFVGARYAITDIVHVRVVSIGLVVSGVLVSLYAVAQQIGLDPIWAELFKGRVFSTMGQANALGAALATALVMTVPLIAGLGRATRWLLTVCAALIGVAFLLTFSRGGYLGLAAGAAVAGAIVLRGLGWTTVRRFLGRASIALAAGLLAIAALSVAWRPAGDLAGRIAARAATIVDPNESSNRIRLDLWTVSVRVAADRPFLGTGPDSYVLVFPRYRDEVLPPDRAAHLAQFRPESPHNVYLAIAAGAGLPAIAAFLVTVAGSLWLGATAALRVLSWPTRLVVAGLTGAATVQLVTNAFVTGEPATFAIWCVTLGALAGVGGRLQAEATAGHERGAPASIRSPSAC